MLLTSVRNAAAILILAASTAAAQNMPVSPALTQGAMPVQPTAPSPCVRGASRLSIGGVDLDLLKCQHIILLQDIASERARAAEAYSKLLAEKMLMESDAAAEAEKSKALADWWAAYVGKGK